MMRYEDFSSQQSVGSFLQYERELSSVTRNRSIPSMDTVSRWRTQPIGGKFWSVGRVTKSRADRSLLSTWNPVRNNYWRFHSPEIHHR
jgi:hypothetical protein